MSGKSNEGESGARVVKQRLSAIAQPRLRVLAGPNGSGKSTIKSELKPKWIGVFVNADEIERDLKDTQGFLSLRKLGIDGQVTGMLDQIKQSLGTSGFEERLDMPSLLSSIALAEAMRQWLLDKGWTFTFETVMSHASKIKFMKDALARGYRVYLYFVATDDPEINIDRVRRRVLQGGHPVDDDKVIERYHKSIALMTSACEVADRAYIFDNSGSKHKLLAEVTFRQRTGRRR